LVTIIKLLEQEIQKKVKEVQSNSLHNAFFERILCNSLKRGGSSGAVKKKKRRKVYKIRLPGTFHNESKRRDSNTRPLRPELYWLKCTKNPQEFSSTLKPCIYKVFTYHITSISIRHIEVNKINVRNLLENYV